MSGGNEKDLNEDYPDYLRTDDFNASNFRYLLPYVLENGKMYRRNECIKLLVGKHEKITGLKVNKTTEQLGNRLKKLFSKNNESFKKASGVTGGWIYIGPVYSCNSNKITTRDEDVVLSPVKEATTKTLNIKKMVEARLTGDETLYVWWHPESEKLAKLEGRNEWAMKIGVHHGRNVENRIEDYKTSIPYQPTFGILVFCNKANILEKCLHSTLRNRKKMVGEMGQEWFVTSVSEIEEILEFNNLI